MSCFGPLKDIHYDALAIKKRAVLLLVKTQESEAKKAITGWKHTVEIQNEGRKCRLLINFMESLNQISKDNLGPFMNVKEIRIKSLALD